MENTGTVLFEDNTPQWYVALGTRWVGPLSAEDVYLKVVAQEISWAHYVWCPGQTDWRRICDTPTFQSAVPTVPAQGMKEAVKEASRPEIRSAKKGTPPPPKPKVEVRTWFLYYNDAQYGPFSDEEISRFLRVGKIHGRVHIWKDGMTDWERLEQVAQFADDVLEAKRVREQRKDSPAVARAPIAPEEKETAPIGTVREQRKAPRTPIVAKIYVANSEVLSVAVCRDISIGGMQVLTDRIPGAPGTRIKMNVSPANDSANHGKVIESFIAEGVIVRILEDGRGFSFRFEKLPDASKRSIEDYLSQAG